MASFDGLASVEPWSFRQSFNIDSWLVPDHDSDVLTKALHRSISTSTTPAGDSFSPSSYFDSAAAVSDLSPQTLSNVSFVSDPDISGVGGVKRKRGGPGDKPAKRRSRVSTKKSQTTFITADAANFRHMVQQVTGAKFVGSSSHGIFSPVVKPEPHRLASRLPPPPSSSAVPTLDTSSFLSNHHQENMVNDFSSVSAPVRTAATVKSGVVGGGSVVELDSYFPTLESWKVM